MAGNVFLFVPNIIDYSRIILAIIAFFFMPTCHVFAAWCYTVSGFLDAIDGHAARLLNQSSKFGAMLDMLTDCCATMCLLVTLAHFYLSYMFFFQLSMALNIASYWLHLHCSVVQGGTSHKLIDLSANPILQIYYHSKIVLFCMCACAGNELFYCMLYLLHFTEGPIIFFIGLWKLICILTFPISFVKSGISVVQLIAASKNMVSLDLAERERAQAKTQ